MSPAPQSPAPASLLMASKPPPLPPGYRELAADCRKFMAAHPDYDRNVFIMTRFVPGDKLLGQLDQELRQTLCRHGLTGLRADDRMFPTDQQLWKNVCVYMLCCKYGVAVLEDRKKDEFNPNVALEYGFMRALNKPTLLLKDVGFHNLRADILGTLHKTFDLFDIAGTMNAPIESWIHDLGLDVQPGASELEQRAHQAYRRLLNVRCAELVIDAARRQKERDDELYFFGEEIARYREFLELQAVADPAHRDAVDEAERRIAREHDLQALPEAIARFQRLCRKP